MVFDELNNYLRAPVCVKGMSSRLTIHEAIKAQLYVLGFRLGYVPVLEATTNRRELNRIDCIFVRKDNSLACAIEVDYSLKRKSIEKLASLSPDIEKIIISYGKRPAMWKAIYRHRKNLSDIKNYIMNTKFETNASIF